MPQQTCKTLRRVDAAIQALRGGEVHWNKNGLPYEIVRGPGGKFFRQEIPTIFPHWAHSFITKVQNIKYEEII